jgi:undecaprenyl diphosphate synthase
MTTVMHPFGRDSVREPRAQGESPKHVAIIMDGNGRWAEQRGLPRIAGHERGADAVRQIVRAARRIGLQALTLYAFSAQNWGRPVREVVHLMMLLRRFLVQERDELIENGIRVTAIGDRARLPEPVRFALRELEDASSHNRDMVLCLALSYGGREDLVRAARDLVQAASEGALTASAVSEGTLGRALATRDLPPLDLLIRTSGEQRLSNFLLWEAAFAELYFTSKLWPDFGAADLEEALASFGQRERRFGRGAMR